MAKENDKKASVEAVYMEKRVFEPSKEFVAKARIKSLAEYKKMYERSLKDPSGFWGDMATEMIDWFKKWDGPVEEYSFKDNINLRYFVGGKLNITYNCLDRHLKTWRRNKAALIFQGEPLEESRTLTYQQLHREVCKFANVLKKFGVKKGDRVAIYLPMIMELPIAMLACARIGAIHSIVFGGFSAEALRDRIQDCQAETLITCNWGYRSGKVLSSKTSADAAMANCPSIKRCIVVNRITKETEMKQGRDYWYHELMSDASPVCEPEWMDSEDPLFILYTSGSTGKPKGVLHTTAGYLLFCMATMKYVFDVRDEDVYWCTADIGWVTGHSYIVYGPLGVGATSIVFESVPNYPEPDRFWEVVEKYGVNIFYTAPTAIRAIMKNGEEWPNKRDLSSLRLLGTVGEPINPEAWMWYYRVIGKERCPITDTWWQTETGGHLICGIPGAMNMKPGSAAMPFFGVDHDHPAPGRDRGGRERGRAPVHQEALARVHAHRVRRPRPVQGAVLHPAPGVLLLRRRRQEGRGRFLLAHGPRGRRDQCVRAPPGNGRDRERPGVASVRRGIRGGRLPARHQGPGHLCLCDLEGGFYGVR